MGHNLDVGAERWATLKNMLDSYYGSDPLNDDPLTERMEAVKADNDAAYVAAVRADIADVLRHNNDDLESVYDAEFRNYYWPGGDGLTPREFLSDMADLLAMPADLARNHRTGLFRD